MKINVKKLITLVLITCFIFQNLNLKIFANNRQEFLIEEQTFNLPENLISSQAFNILSEDELPPQSLNLTGENTIATFRKENGLTFAIPAGLYFIPGIGEVVIATTGAILVAGIAIEVGSVIYNAIIDWFQQHTTHNPSDEIDWDISTEQKEIYIKQVMNDLTDTTYGIPEFAEKVLTPKDFIGYYENLGIYDDNSVEKNWKALLPYLKEVIDKPNKIDVFQDTIVIYDKYFPEKNIGIGVSVNGTKIIEASAGRNLGDLVDYYSGTALKKLEALIQQDDMKKLNITTGDISEDKYIFNWIAFEASQVTYIPGSPNLIRFDKYFKEIGKYLSCIVKEDVSGKLSYEDIFFSRPDTSDDVVWEIKDGDKHHILYGSKGKHILYWKNFGMDPKRPDNENWNIMLPFFKKAMDKADEIIPTINDKGQKFVYFIKHFEEQKVTMKVMFIKLEDGFRLSDIWPLWR